ncbi:zinc finger protein 394-like isoform X4 [Pelodiscus sinensis]|uniref:zinc finger protein 394-like isoform X4 n=1 Tax=Pelodiscus sinensis TaxID=13735 RepID=UPI003F6BE055
MVSGGPDGQWMGTLPIQLTKMGPQDDPEAFLTTFERVAAAARWPEDQWATLLAPYLTGLAQLAYWSLSAKDALHFFKMKEAVLDQLGVTPDTCRQRFRQERFGPQERPRAVAQRLREWARKWIEPDQKTAGQVMEIIILEQFINILLREGQKWVKQNQSTTVNEAVYLMEAYMAVEEGEGSRPRLIHTEPKVQAAWLTEPTSDACHALETGD